MWLEILLGFYNKINGFAGIVFFVNFIFLVVCYIVVCFLRSECNRINKEKPLDSWDKEKLSLFDCWSSLKKSSTIVFCVLLLPASLPSMEYLWYVRINLIKLQLSNPENIQKSTETIERIAEKLECKYLGCEKKEEKK